MAADSGKGRFDRFGPPGPREDFFSAVEYERRLTAIRAAMSHAGLDALVTFSPANVTYACGHFTTNLWDFQCLVIPIDQRPFMVLWYFELGRFYVSSVGSDVEAYGTGEDPLQCLLDTLRGRNLYSRRIGIDEGSASISPAVFAKVKDALANGVPCQGIIEEVRLIKSPAEIDILRRAARLSAIGVRAAITAGRAGVTDFAVAGACNAAMFTAGSHTMAIDPFICGGWRSGTPHSNATGHVFQRGDSMLIEVGGNIGRYTTPVMRSAAIEEIRPEIRKLHTAATHVLDAVANSLRPGALASDIAAIGTEALGDLEPDVIYHYTFGYPVGVGFPPTWLESTEFLLVRQNNRLIEAGMVFHIPVSLRRHGKYGIGMSDTMLVTEKGADILTNHLTRDITICL
jgi:Xaa-Pro dipeptidase